MYISRIISNWFKKNQHLFFAYRNGFYHLNYVANSPRLVMESFRKMLFCKFDAKSNSVTANNPFALANLQFAFLEDGLSLMKVNMFYKKNISFQQVINPETPSDYYTLSYNILSNPTNPRSIELRELSFTDRKWILTKPGFLTNINYFKNTKSDSILIFFNQHWLENYLIKDNWYKNSKIKSFFESDEEFVVWPDNSIELSRMAESIKETLEKDSIQNPLQLKLKTYELVSAFIRSYNPENIFKNYKNLTKKDILRINRVEFYLLENIQSKFFGIDFLSNQFSISPTKLKSDFKSAYGVGIFAYFRKKQMSLAKELLENDEYQVQEVAQLFGYENTSKFSKAFESENGVLPSKIAYHKEDSTKVI